MPMLALPFAHPVEPPVRARIMETLAQLEAQHSIRILLAVESGSRGWGFASPDSDYDVRFIYVHRPEWYLTVRPGRDVIEQPINDELDVSGWELRKALGLLASGNATLQEWLDSPICYRAEAPFLEALQVLAARCFSPLKARHHYLSMATKNYREHLMGDEVRLKKYLYALRPLLAVRWIDAGRGMPPMRFVDLVQPGVMAPPAYEALYELLEEKMQVGETRLSPSKPLLNQFIEAELARPQPQDWPVVSVDWPGLNALLAKTILEK